MRITDQAAKQLEDANYTGTELVLDLVEMDAALEALQSTEQNSALREAPS